MKEGLNHNK